MGYTHYWDNRTFTVTEWQRLQDMARRIFKQAKTEGIKLRGWDGTGKPEISADVISFNGDGDDGHETCRIERKGDSAFCKTSRKPYDVVVVALLMAAKETGALSWTSDGDPHEHADGRMLLGRAESK